MSNPSNERVHESPFGNVVFTYTRSQALADGVLVDAGALAREAGFVLPVALTAAVWDDCVAWTEHSSRKQIQQDESGRLWDVLVMAVHAIRTQAGAATSQRFWLHRVPRNGRSVQATPVQLKLAIGPGDDGEPVITILLPQED